MARRTRFVLSAGAHGKKKGTGRRVLLCKGQIYVELRIPPCSPPHCRDNSRLCNYERRGICRPPLPRRLSGPLMREIFIDYE